MKRESFFYAYSRRNLPDGKSFADTAVLSLENESLKNLDPFSVAFFDFDVDPDSVAYTKSRDIVFLIFFCSILKYPFVSSFPPRRSWRNHFQRTARNNLYSLTHPPHLCKQILYIMSAFFKPYGLLRPRMALVIYILYTVLGKG